MEEKEFLKLVVSLIIPFVDIISKDRLGSIVSYKKLLEYINGNASQSSLESAMNYAYE